ESLFRQAGLYQGFSPLAPGAASGPATSPARRRCFGARCEPGRARRHASDVTNGRASAVGERPSTASAAQLLTSGDRRYPWRNSPLTATTPGATCTWGRLSG